MPIRKPCKGRSRKVCKQAPRSCRIVKKSVRAKSYCRTRKSSRRTRRLM